MGEKMENLIELLNDIVLHPAHVRSVGPVMDEFLRSQKTWCYHVAVDGQDKSIKVSGPDQAVVEENRKHVLARWNAWQR